MTDKNDNLDEWAIDCLLAEGCSAASLEDKSGWNNRVWLSDSHVLRLSSGRFPGSFEHEVMLYELVSRHMRTPELVASGCLGDREWLIFKRAADNNLLECWPNMAMSERADAITQLGAALKTLHALEVPSGFSNPWIQRAIDEDIRAQFYLVSPDLAADLVRGLRAENVVDESLAAQALSYFDRTQRFFAEDEPVIIHGDVHFANLTWDGEALCMIDWELATLAAPDRELQMLLDFVIDPGMVGTAFNEQQLVKEMYPRVVGWLASIYPSLFSNPDLIERLNVYALMRALHQTRHFAMGRGDDPSVTIDAILSGELIYKQVLDGAARGE